mmetsp:Transcript_128997/g.359166  ORF Transcript_128997/g.359166 Transcript_128997/m.359166 type:complete len:259 (-) Transcript_128997:274-1050(-)
MNISPPQSSSRPSAQSYKWSRVSFKSGPSEKLPAKEVALLVKPLLGVGCVRTVSAVITPQAEPPPPRRAHSRSEFSVRLALTSEPLASTSSTSSKLSTPRPLELARGPWPPPTLQPATPTVVAQPVATKRLGLCSEAALLISPKVRPAPSFTELSLHSMPLSSDVRIMSPLSALWRFRKSCPVPATDTQRLCLRANSTHVCTCSLVRGHTTNAGSQFSCGRLRVAILQKSVAIGRAQFPVRFVRKSRRYKGFKCRLRP